MGFYKRQPDIIIRNGTIVDGTGKLPYYADVAVIGDKIDYIGNLKDVSAPLEMPPANMSPPASSIPTPTQTAPSENTRSARALFTRVSPQKSWATAVFWS